MKPPEQLADLEKLRDALAYDWHSNDATFSCDSEVGFKAGFDACLRALSESAGELNEDALADFMSKAFDDELNITCALFYRLVGMGSRWQHAQDAARIGLAEKLASTRARENETLQARLAEHEDIAKELSKLHRAEYEAGQKKIDRCAKKLQASEARVKDLQMVCRRLSAAKSIETRNKIAEQCHELFKGSVLRE